MGKPDAACRLNGLAGGTKKPSLPRTPNLGAVDLISIFESARSVIKIFCAILLWAALLPPPASAQLNCWWNGMGMQCQPGWSWNAQQRREERREDRREEWRDRRHEEREAPRQQERPEWCQKGGLWYRC